MQEFKVGDTVRVPMKIIDEGLGKYGLSYKDLCSFRVGKKTLDEIAAEKTYEDGLSEAWETARRLNAVGCFMEMSTDDFDELFGSRTLTEIFNDFTPQEASAKIKEWEDAKEICVGDVVKITVGEFEGVVSKIKGEGCYVIFGDGSSWRFGKSDIIKTGRTIDIAGLLAQIEVEE